MLWASDAPDRHLTVMLDVLLDQMVELLEQFIRRDVALLNQVGEIITVDGVLFAGGADGLQV